MSDNVDKENRHFFREVKASAFKNHLKKAYWGIPPFEKDYSYSDFKMAYEGGFPEILFANRFLHSWARILKIKPTKEDQVKALKLFRLVQHKAEGVKCECCKGTGFKKKLNNKAEEKTD